MIGLGSDKNITETYEEICQWNWNYQLTTGKIFSSAGSSNTATPDQGAGAGVTRVGVDVSTRDAIQGGIVPPGAIRCNIWCHLVN